MQRSLCRVKGQNQWSMLFPRCRDPLHPHSFKELEKTGQLPESAKYEEGGFQLLQHVKTSNFGFLLLNLKSLHIKKNFFLNIETPILKSPGSMQLVNVNQRPWQERVNYTECHAWGLSASKTVCVVPGEWILSADWVTFRSLHCFTQSQNLHLGREHALLCGLDVPAQSLPLSPYEATSDKSKILLPEDTLCET